MLFISVYDNPFKSDYCKANHFSFRSPVHSADEKVTYTDFPDCFFTFFEKTPPAQNALSIGVWVKIAVVAVEAVDNRSKSYSEHKNRAVGKDVGSTLTVHVLIHSPDFDWLSITPQHKDTRSFSSHYG